jgi:predicted DNA-binding protein
MKEKVTEERIGSIVRARLYQKLDKLSKMLGRSKSDLLKEGIWEIINQKQQKNKKEVEQCSTF